MLLLSHCRLGVQGQQDVAVRYVQGLLAGMEREEEERGQARQHSLVQRAYLQCLAAKWLSRTRCVCSCHCCCCWCLHWQSSILCCRWVLAESRRSGELQRVFFRSGWQHGRPASL